MLLTYPVFVVEELATMTVTILVTYAIVLRFEMPVTLIIPILAALSILGLFVLHQVHGPDTDGFILRFAGSALVGAAGLIHMFILKLRFSWLETGGIAVASGTLSTLIYYLLL